MNIDVIVILGLFFLLGLSVVMNLMVFSQLGEARKEIKRLKGDVK